MQQRASFDELQIHAVKVLAGAGWSNADIAAVLGQLQGEELAAHCRKHKVWRFTDGPKLGKKTSP